MPKPQFQTIRLHCFHCDADMQVKLRRAELGGNRFDPLCPNCHKPFQLICENCKKRYVPTQWKWNKDSTPRNRACTGACMRKLQRSGLPARGPNAEKIVAFHEPHASMSYTAIAKRLHLSRGYVAQVLKGVKKMTTCALQGVGLPDGKHCLGEFPKTTCKIYCDVCQPYAYAAGGVEYRKANRAKLARKSRRERAERAKATGRPIRRLGAMASCEFRDEHGRRAPGCKRRFKRKAGTHKYCKNCKPLAKAVNRKKSEKKNAPKIKEKASKRWQELNRAPAEVKELRIQRDNLRDELASVQAKLDDFEKADHPITLRDGRIVGNKPGPKPNIERDAFISKLDEQGLKLSVIGERVKEAFGISLGADAIRKARDRHQRALKKRTR